MSKIHPISKRAESIQDSITLKISGLAKQMKKDGKDVIGFGAGEPDFDTPINIQQAAIQAIQSGKTRYTPASGLNELKELVAEKFKTDNHLQYKPENIVISCGAKHSIANIILAMIDSGDEVIIPTPYWVSYPDQVAIAGGKPVFISTNEASQFKITPQQLQESITPRSKVLILNSPSNPTGMIYSPKELADLAEIILKHSLYVISDEIYEKLVYGNHTHTSIAALSQEMQNLTIVVNGASKAYAMTGWRIGYLAAPTPIANAISRIQSHTTSNPTTPSQWAAIEALRGPQSEVEKMRVAFDERRKYIVNRLNEIPGITCVEPQGAFYVFPNISSLFNKNMTNSAQFCDALLKEALVACVPGSGFGADQNIRLSYATSMDNLNKGIDRIAEWVGALNIFT